MTDIDWTKLPPAPWVLGEPHEGIMVLRAWHLSLVTEVALPYEVAALQFAALARAAFDVMARRQWWPMPCYTSGVGTRWQVLTGNNAYREIEQSEHPDPFTALAAADAWVKANVEAKGEPT